MAIRYTALTVAGFTLMLLNGKETPASPDQVLFLQLLARGPISDEQNNMQEAITGLNLGHDTDRKWIP